MMDWLGIWEPRRYFGKHEKSFPADDAIPYTYNPNVHGNDAWLRDWSRVQRAIPVEGTMERISWLSRLRSGCGWTNRRRRSGSC